MVMHDILTPRSHQDRNQHKKPENRHMQYYEFRPCPPGAESRRPQGLVSASTSPLRRSTWRRTASSNTPPRLSTRLNQCRARVMPV